MLQRANSPLSQEVSWPIPTPLKGREPHGGNAISHSTPENYERDTAPQSQSWPTKKRQLPWDRSGVGGWGS